MPHSSGGGSHSGGSHHSGSHSSHGGGGSSYRTSSRPFSGASHYIIYRNNSYRHLYTNDPKPKAMSKDELHKLVVIWLFIVPFIIFVLATLVCSFNPRKTALDYDTKIRITDITGTLSSSEKASLKETLTIFQQKTGITPAIEVVDPDTAAFFDSLEKMAYNEYVRRFDDEKHWLLLVSYPSNASGLKNWKFEGMIGDDLGNTIDESYEELFTDTVQDNFIKYADDSLFLALNYAYFEYTGKVMKFHVDWAAVLGMVVSVFIMDSFFVVFSLIGYLSSQKWAEAVKLDNNLGELKEVTCDYCNGIYIAHTRLNCPHCGAPAKTE